MADDHNAPDDDCPVCQALASIRDCIAEQLEGVLTRLPDEKHAEMTKFFANALGSYAVSLMEVAVEHEAEAEPPPSAPSVH